MIAIEDMQLVLDQSGGINGPADTQDILSATIEICTRLEAQTALLESIDKALRELAEAVNELPKVLRPEDYE